MATFQLQWAVRDGSSQKTRRTFLDFIIGGVSLYNLCKREGIENISCIWQPDIYKPAVERLLLQRAPDLPDKHYSLYVCAECGDIGCGAISVRIERKQNQIIWRDFAYQNNYDESMTYKPKSFGKVDPSSFEINAYRELLSPFLK